MCLKGAVQDLACKFRVPYCQRQCTYCSERRTMTTPCVRILPRSISYPALDVCYGERLNFTSNTIRGACTFRNHLELKPTFSTLICKGTCLSSTSPLASTYPLECFSLSKCFGAALPAPPLRKSHQVCRTGFEKQGLAPSQGAQYKLPSISTGGLACC